MPKFLRSIKEFVSNTLAGGDSYREDYVDEYGNEYDDFDDNYDRYDDEEYETVSTGAPEIDISSIKRPEKKKEGGRTTRLRNDNVYELPREVTSSAPSARPYEVVHMTPMVMQDAITLGEHVREGRMIIVHLAEMEDRELSQRIADYLSGVADSLNGKIGKLNRTSLAVTPRTFDVKELTSEANKREPNKRPDFLRNASNG